MGSARVTVAVVQQENAECCQEDLNESAKAIK